MDTTTYGDLMNIPVAEKIVGHEWNSMGTDFNKIKFANMAKKTEYNFEPKLDEDVVVSLNDLKSAEK